MEVFNDYPRSLCGKEGSMEPRGNIASKENSTYIPSHVKAVVKSLGLRVLSEANDNLSLLCPFHNNTNTYSFSISSTSGAWLCFNPSCGESGNLVELVKRILAKNDFQAMRYIYSLQPNGDDIFEEELNSLLEDKPEFIEFSDETLKTLHEGLINSVEAKNYFNSRKINDSSIEYFNLGYSEKQNMVTVPVHSPNGIAVGIVGRSIVDKRFKNSTNLPKSKTLFNIHRAKRIGGNVIVVESSFDAIIVHQAGFPNVVATLGGHISPENVSLLNRYFNKIILMTDADQPGRDLGMSIASKLRTKEVLWASHTYGKIYPHDAKDAGDMTEDEIKSCINNAVSDIEYRSWNP